MASHHDYVERYRFGRKASVPKTFTGDTPGSNLHLALMATSWKKYRAELLEHEGRYVWVWFWNEWTRPLFGMFAILLIVVCPLLELVGWLPETAYDSGGVLLGMAFGLVLCLLILWKPGFIKPGPTPLPPPAQRFLEDRQEPPQGLDERL